MILFPFPEVGKLLSVEAPSGEEDGPWVDEMFRGAIS